MFLLIFFGILFPGNLRELTRLEKENKIRPSPEIDAFMKVAIF